MSANLCHSCRACRKTRAAFVIPEAVTMTSAAHDEFIHTTMCDRHPSARATHRASRPSGAHMLLCTHCRDARFEALTDQGFRIVEVEREALLA